MNELNKAKKSQLTTKLKRNTVLLLIRKFRTFNEDRQIF